MASASEVRARSAGRVAELGLARPPHHLPIVWDDHNGARLRPLSDLVERLAILNVVITRTYGMPAESALQWIRSNALEAGLTRREAGVVSGAVEPDLNDRAQVESVQALAWLISVVLALNPARFCDDDLVAHLPDLRVGEPVDSWSRRMRPSLMSLDRARNEWDFHYCVTWALADANLRGNDVAIVVPQYVYWQRRRALEFAFGEGEWAHTDWDDIDLST